MVSPQRLMVFRFAVRTVMGEQVLERGVHELQVRAVGPKAAPLQEGTVDKLHRSTQDQHCEEATPCTSVHLLMWEVKGRAPTGCISLR